MASSLVAINQTSQPTSTNTAAGENESSASLLNRNSTSQHAKLKINLNDVVASVADSIQLATANSTLISPCTNLNKSSQMSPILILSDNIDLNKTFSLANTDSGPAISTNGQIENAESTQFNPDHNHSGNELDLKV